jgi:hypothetical protein
VDVRGSADLDQDAHDLAAIATVPIVVRKTSSSAIRAVAPQWAQAPMAEVMSTPKNSSSGPAIAFPSNACITVLLLCAPVLP